MNSLRQLFILSIVCSLTVSCAFKKKKEVTSAKSQTKSCQALLNELPEHLEQNTAQKVKTASKTGLHYLAVGTGAIADVVVIFAAGVAVGVTVCSPMLIADSLKKGNSNLTASCVNAFMRESTLPGLYDFPITNYVDGKTYQLTCPDLKEFQKKLGEVFKCRDSSHPQDQIHWQVNKILKDKTLRKCIPNAMAALL